MADFPKVYTVTGKFMVLPRDHVHAYVVELENSVVVVDSTLASSSGLNVRKVAESTGKPIEAVLLTHGHPDHWGGLIHFEDVPRLGSQGALDFALEEDRVKSPTASMYLGDDWPERHIFVDEIVKDGDSFTFDGVKFTFNDLGPGESPSDGMWSFEKDGMRSVFIGDSIASYAHCFVRDLHVDEWLKLLDRLEKEFSSGPPTSIYIGHGGTPTVVQTIEWQRGYLKAFVEAAKAAQDKIDPPSRATQEAIIAKMQAYLPGEATLFLFDYELDVSLPIYWKKWGLLK
ncbi:MAG: MBL fold metallo-hydrolase [Phycisphaerae bacterium]|nr:MBL fold metallo-hydrolase [Phycisphaerae bacterium]